MKALLKEETLIILVVAALALSGLFYLDNVDLPNITIGGLLGYLTKSAGIEGDK